MVTAICVIASGVAARAELVTNGGFETGDFIGWTQSGNLGATGVGSSAHTGTYGAYLGPVGSLGFLSQTLATSPGCSYLLTYWLNNDGYTPNEFLASWEGTAIYDQTNLPAFVYTQFSFNVTATTTAAVLSFGFRNDPGFLNLDDVSVNLVGCGGTCGNGIPDAGEDCDLGAANGSSTSCCTSSCTYRTAGETCRPAADACDMADTCSGSSGACPADAKQPAGAPCGSSSDTECDNPDSCDGSGSCLSHNVADNTPCHGGNNNTCLNACATGACVAHTFANCCGNGTLDTGELCDDGNQVNGDECSTACSLNLDHFQCYRSLVLTPQPPIGPEVLVDQFHTINAQPGKPKSICNPANKNGEDATAPTHPAHLESYPIRTDPRKDISAILPIRNLKVVNQFGTLYVDAVQVKDQLVPTAKELAAQPPPLVAPTLDNFTCYKVRSSKGKPRFTPIHNVSIQDQFGSLSVTVGRPTRLCLPTNKYNDEPGAENHIAHLMCYHVRGKFSSPGRVFTNNSFGPGELYVRFPNELCVPSVKNPT